MEEVQRCVSTRIALIRRAIRQVRKWEERRLRGVSTREEEQALVSASPMYSPSLLNGTSRPLASPSIKEDEEEAAREKARIAEEEIAMRRCNMQTIRTTASTDYAGKGVFISEPFGPCSFGTLCMLLQG